MKLNSIFSMGLCAALFVAGATFTSCSDDDSFAPNQEVFDFSTVKTVKLNAQLGQQAKEDVIGVFETKDAALKAAQREDLTVSNQKSDMIYSCFLNEEGAVNATINMPKRLNKMYVISLTNPALGVATVDVKSNVSLTANDFVKTPETANAPRKANSLITEDWHCIATYAYEDIWPTGGDFDLNDIIIEHWQQMTYTSKNYVRVVRDVFKLVSKKDAATYADAFYVQVPANQKKSEADFYSYVEDEGSFEEDELLTEEGNCYEEETQSIVVFNNQHNMFAKGIGGVMVVRAFSGIDVTKDDVCYNPYIISQADKNLGAGRYEVHIPGYPITSLGKVLPNTPDNFYATQFVSEGGEYPFAVSLQGVSGWQAPDPAVRVCDTFTHYDAWTKSKGAEYNDWYLNKAGYDVRK